MFQCMWNTCWWYDCPEAGQHYLEPDTVWSGSGPPWTRSGIKLSGILEEWRDERLINRPWLRSLRPPASALGCGLRAIPARHELGISCISISPDGSRVASASLDQTTRLWDLTSGIELVNFGGDVGPVQSVTFSPDGRRLATGAADGRVRLYDTESRELVAEQQAGDALKSGPLGTLSMATA